MPNNVYNRIYTKEKWNRVNEFNKSLLEDYILQIKSEGKSEGSQKQYYNDARIILIYILEENKNKELYKLTRKSFRNFTLWMKENGLSSSRINRLLVTARNLLNFGSDDDEYSDDFEDMKVNPSRIKGMQKEERREIVFLTNDEVMLIYNTLIEEKKYSQALFCSLMYDSCSRRQELFQVKTKDISLDSNICKSQVRGKRGKMYRPLYNDMTKNAYKLLIENYPDKEDLWLTTNGSSASYESLYNWVVSWRDILKEKTGVYKKFNPHSFRHSSLENLENGTHYIAIKLNKKFEISELQKFANHSDISTTMGYLKDKDEDILLEAFGL